MAVCATYLWFASAGQWTSLPETTNYYDQLADAFRQGHVYLDAMPNPQDKLPKVIDFSLYKGKYYLYFGAVPALFLSSIKLFTKGATGDQYLVLMFAVGLYVFQCLLILNISKQFFQKMPIWTILICVPLIGFSNPLIYILVTARVYEAAVTAGQFFLMGGLYYIFSAFDKSSFSSTKLMTAGAFFALAIGSRITLSLSVAWVVFMATYLIVKISFDDNKSRMIYYVTALLSPLILGVFIIGQYNLARFDSVFETGFSYTFIGMRFHEYNIAPFDPIDLLQNLYNYFLHPPRSLHGFPFFSANGGNQISIFSFVKLPDVYTGEQVTGLFFSSPFLFFSLLPILLFLIRLIPGKL